MIGSIYDKIPSQHRRAPDLQGAVLDVRDVDRRVVRGARVCGVRVACHDVSRV